MKAAVLNQVGDTKLELRDDVTTTDVGPREIRIRVLATGVCHSDVSAMDGTLPAPPCSTGARRSHEGEQAMWKPIVVRRTVVPDGADARLPRPHRGSSRCSMCERLCRLRTTRT